MIEYDYLIERDEGNEVKEFRPDKIPKKMENICYIEGPNSTGKSTLLNIIALGLYGLKNNRLHPALQDKLKSLVGSNHQKLKFTIKIKNKNGSLEIVSEKLDLNKPEIVVKEISSKGERKLSKEMFERDYNLIYDIPHDPTQRLNHLIDDIKDAQIRYGNSIGRLKETVRRILAEIDSSRNPKRISQLETEYNNKENELSICNKTVEKQEQQINIIEDYTYFRFYNEYKLKLSQIQGKIENLRKNAIKTEKKTHHQNSEYYTNLEIARRTIEEMQSIYNKVSDLLNISLTKDKHYLNIWQKINLKKALEELQFDENLEECILHFKRVLREQEDELKEDESSKEADFFNALIEVLENYKRFNLTIPGMEKSISEFIHDLKVAAEKHETIIKKIKNIEETDAELAKLKREMDKLNTSVFPDMIRLKPLLGTKMSDYITENAEQEINSLNNQLSEFQNKYEYYENLYSGKGKPNEKEIMLKGGKKIRDYTSYTEEQLKDKIKELRNSINDETANKRTLEHSKISISTELERLKDKKPHRFQNQVEALNELLSKLNLLEKKFKMDYDQYIKNIIDKDLPKNITKEQEKYNDVVFQFLAKKIGRFIHGNKDFRAVKVDLVDRIIYTEDKKKIHLEDMGTGQSQSAYLKGLLNTSDKRKIIAMFDEVAMMDTKSLEPIYKGFKELYEEGKLLVGIVVQRGEEVNVISKIK